jgi:hypothetical protein
LVESLRRRRRFRRKELERKRGRIPAHDVPDVHNSALIFVRAGTFGQLTRQILSFDVRRRGKRGMPATARSQTPAREILSRLSVLEN